MGPQWSGVVLIDKPEGVSSFSALGSLKKRYNTKKVGHTGTLDPFATGLLVALVGSATRCARFFVGLDKRYEAEFTFGTATDTDDCTGTMIRECAPPEPGAVESVLPEFMGTIAQIPPSFSAVHVNGSRAYHKARRGEDVELPSREVTVHELTVQSTSASQYEVNIRCTSGTYVRSLARDIGERVGSAAHVSALRRTDVGEFSVEEIEDEYAELPIHDALLRAGVCERWDIDAATAEALWNGRQPGHGPDTGERIIAVLNDTPVAIGRATPAFEFDLVFPRSDA